MMKEEETAEQWLEWICEAIKKIRHQKQRPSLERVVNAIKLHTPYTDGVITARLDDFVEKGQILKILTKGKAAFKDPGTSQGRFVVVDKETDLVKIVVKAVKDLDAGDGTQFKHIEKYVPQSNCLDVKPDVDLCSLLKTSLKRAVERNLLIQDGKTYKALPEEPKTLKSPKTPVLKKVKDPEKAVSPSPKTPGRKKKVNEETPKKSGLPICSECLGTAKRNKLGAEEALSICNGCGASIHPSCAAKGDLFTVLISKGNIWHCEECATCTKCRTTDKVCIWKCGACERGYHLDCMSPAVDKKTKTPWKCYYCVEGKPEKNSDVVASLPNTPTTPMTSPRKQKSLRTQQLRSLSKAARATGKKAQNRSLSIESSSEDGNDDEPNQSPSYPTSFPPSGGRRIEISETISKEKQKFFRCSAFYKKSQNDKNREPEAPKSNAITPVTPLTQFPRHIPPLNPNSSDRMPFGSDDSDEPWGFAAVKFEAAKVTNAKGRRWKKEGIKHKSPSSLVKSAVNSKIHERKKLIAEGRATHRLTLDEWSRDRHADAAAITSIISNELPPGVTQKDLETFKTARENASKLTKPNLASADPDMSGSGSLRCPASIEFGQHHIHTWYSSPFPQEYARLGKLFLCEYCLKYTKSKAVLKRHLHKCTWRHPPGTEIYRHENLSVFEVDGNVAKFYCQNLCLLAKLFLDHKTLYYDVEPFLFYVLTKNDEQGFHLVGYFSKEKHCLQKYNVSCIMTLPHYQRQGFGRFLIDFSYLLSKQEGQPGTPEKPLSDLGRVSYHAYWKSVILEYLNDHRDEDFSIKELCKESGVKAQDIAEMLQIMGMIRPSKDGQEGCKVVLAVDWAAVDAHAEKVKKSIRIKIEPECLRWTPLIPTLVNPYKIINSEDNEEDEDKADSEDEDNKVDVEELETKSLKSEKIENKTLKSEKVESKAKVDVKTPKNEIKTPKIEIKTPKVEIKTPKIEKSESKESKTLKVESKKGESKTSKVEKESEIDVKPTPKSTRVKQSLLPALFKKQKEMAEVSKVQVEEPPSEKRRRGTKKKYTEIEEDDDETSEPQVEPPPDKKRKKTIEASPLIKPSRLKIPDTPITPMDTSAIETPDTVNGRRTRRPRLTETKEEEKEEEEELEEKTPRLSRRQIAARERWAKKKQKTEDPEETNDVIDQNEEPEEETPAKNTRKKPKRDVVLKEKVDEEEIVETPVKKEVKKTKKKELPKEKVVKRAKKVETDSEGEKSDEIESRISKRKSLRGATKVEEVERRRGRSRLAKVKKEIPTRKSLRVLVDDTDAQSSEVDDDVQPETPPRPHSASNSAPTSDEDVAEPQKPKLVEESVNEIDNDDSLPPPVLPPAITEKEKRSQDEEIEKEKKRKEEAERKEEEFRQEVKKREEEEKKKKEEEERKQKVLEEELRQKEEERKRQEEIARKKEEEIRIKHEEEMRQKHEEELKRKQEEELRLKAEEEMRRKQEEEAKRIQEEKKKLEEEMRMKEELKRKEEEEKKRLEEERRKREEEELLRKKQEEERKRIEEEKMRQEAEERKRKEEEERRKREDDERRKREDDERRKREDEERRKREEEARKKEMLKMPSSISVPIPNYPMPQSAPLLHPVAPPLIHHAPLLHPVKSELKPEEYDITKPLKKDDKDREKAFSEVKKPMEVDLTEDSRSPAKDERHEKSLKKEQKAYDPKHPYPTPKDKKEKKHEDHKREELKPKVPVYNEHPNPVHPMYSGCGEMDVNMIESQSNEMLEQQRLQQQYSDCAQQSLLHHHHLTPSPHMNMVYQQQRKQVARSSGSNNQRHHHPSPPSHYHQSPNYIMPQNSPYVSVLHRGVQNPQRISPSCSVSSPNIYFQQQNSPNSLVQLQKLTNGLESIPGHGTPPPRVDLTPPPNHSTTPNPYKYQYQRHITPPPQRPHNMLQYNTFNNYSRQQSPSVAGYIANSASFINQAQLPMQMMQSQYPQDPQQNSMYPNVAYGYHINSSLMQPLNGTMRR